MMRHARLVLVIAGKHLLELSRMPGILAAIFVPGIVLYAIFTLVLPTGGGGGAGLPAIRLAVVDHDDSPASQKLVTALGRMSVNVIATDADGNRLTEDEARHRVEKQRVAAALIIPDGYAGRLFDRTASDAGVDLIVDQTQRMAADMVSGMLQMAAGMALFEMAGEFLVTLTGQRILGAELPEASASEEAAAPPATGNARQLIRVHRRGVSVERQDSFPPPSMLYLAGLIPMFLLFNSSGAASGILTEMETGATRRIMVAPVTSADYLFGYMVSGMTMAFAQCVTMYAFAALVFGAPVVKFATGLTLLTLATCLSTVGFGVLMAGLSRSAEQLNSLGTVVILGMSAIGGSMFPRFMMPDWVKPLGLFTINGWAYEGYLDVVLGKGTLSVLPETAVLVLIGIASSALGSVLLSRRLRGVAAD